MQNNMNFLRQGFQKLSSDRHTAYRQTDAHEESYTVTTRLHGWSFIKLPYEIMKLLYFTFVYPHLLYGYCIVR